MLRDTHFRAEAPGEGITEEDKARYLASARAIVRDGLDDADVVAKGKKAPKFHRTAAQDWLLAADHMFLVLTGTGLQRFMPHGHDPVPVPERPMVVFILDKGSDRFCTVWYALYLLEMRVLPVFGPMHVPY